MSDYAVVIAARMSSTRLPGKALLSYTRGQSNLAQIVNRWRMLSRRNPAIIVATTYEPEDNAIETECLNLRVPCFRGHPLDVLGRVNQAVGRYAPAAEYVARAMADNPLVDVGLVDWRVDTLRETGADSVWFGADHERITYAGTTDVWSRAAWDRIVAESSGDEHEHPGLYFWQNMSRFSVVPMTLGTGRRPPHCVADDAQPPHGNGRGYRGSPRYPRGNFVMSHRFLLRSGC